MGKIFNHMDRPPTLSRAASQVMDYARKIRAYYNTELPKRHPNYPLVDPRDRLTPAPPEQEELDEYLTSLPEETVYQLLLLMYLGRGDYDTVELAGNYRYLKEMFHEPRLAANQMMDKAPLAKYLATGLDKLHKDGLDADKLLAKLVKTRKR